MNRLIIFFLILLLCSCEKKEIDCAEDAKSFDIKSKRGQEIARKCGDYIIKNGVTPYTGGVAFKDPQSVYLSVNENVDGERCWNMFLVPFEDEKEEEILKCINENYITSLFSIMDQGKYPNYVSAYTKYVVLNKDYDKYASAASFNALMGDNKKAIELITEALKHDPRKANYLRYAIYLGDDGQNEKSAAILNSIYNDVSNSFSKLGGATKYHSSLDVDPNMEYHILLRYTYDLIMLGKYGEATNTLESIPHKNKIPSSKQPDTYLLHLLLEKRQYDCQRTQEIAKHKEKISSTVGEYLEFDKDEVCF